MDFWGKTFNRDFSFFQKKNIAKNELKFWFENAIYRDTRRLKFWGYDVNISIGKLSNFKLARILLTSHFSKIDSCISNFVPKIDIQLDHF